MKSIKSKILCIVIFALVAVSTSIGTVSYYITHSIMHRNADEILRSVSIEKASDVNEIFKTGKNAVHIVSVYASSSLENAEQLREETFFNEYSRQVEALFTNIATVTDGIVGYYFRFAPDLTSSTAGFFFNKDLVSNTFFRVPTTDLSLYEPTDTEHVGWYYEAVNAGRAVWMDPYLNKNNNIEMISYVIPVYCDGVLIGVAGVDIAFEFLSTSIDNIKVYESGFAYLINKEGQIIYSPYTPGDFLEKVGSKITEASAALDNGMRLTVCVGYQDIQRESRFLLMNIVAIDIILSIIFILITIYCANHIINPLKKLTKMARSLADGDKISELASTSKDEVGTLSRIFMETSEKLQENMSYIKALAYRDTLTGVKNTTAYMEAVADLEKQINCGWPQFAVLVADINNLKLVNDTYGHDAGNQLIIHASRLLGGIFRYSPLFRIGGDEFVVILGGRDYQKYRQRIKQLDEDVMQEIISIDGTDVTLSLARGIAVYNPEIDRTYNDVFNHADQAMYMHKQSSKELEPQK